MGCRLADQMGFSDFAGSTLVHSTGGWAALVGALIIGPRAGRYVDGRVRPMPGSSMPLATLGMFILWLGWFGFNGASQLALGTISDAVSVSNIFVNTNMAAAGGAMFAFAATKMVYKKIDLTMVLNGALAGLVSITAEPLTPTPISATLIGGVGGILVVFAVPFIDKLKIDDVVGAISVHLVCGIWGTLRCAAHQWRREHFFRHSAYRRCLYRRVCHHHKCNYLVCPEANRWVFACPLKMKPKGPTSQNWAWKPTPSSAKAHRSSSHRSLNWRGRLVFSSQTCSRVIAAVFLSSLY